MRRLLLLLAIMTCLGVVAFVIAPAPASAQVVQTFGSLQNNNTGVYAWQGQNQFLVGVELGPITFSQLGSISTSTTLVYISDGAAGSIPCAGGGSGALAIRITSTWNCGSTGGGTITGIIAGSGLTGGGSSGVVTLSLLLTCSTSQVLVWNGTTWACTSIGTYTLQVNGATLTNNDIVNFNSSVPANGANGINVVFQTSRSVATDSISAYVPGNGNASQYLSGTGVFSTPAGSGGTVTTFSAGNLSPLFTTSVATATSTPALTFALSNASADTVFGNATGSSAAPGFTTNPAVSSLTTVSATNAGLLSLTGNTANPTIGSNVFGWLGPASASFTSYVLQPSSTPPSGTQYLGCGTPSSNISTCSWAALTVISGGTQNLLAKFNSAGTNVINSQVTDDGSTATQSPLGFDYSISGPALLTKVNDTTTGTGANLFACKSATLGSVVKCPTSTTVGVQGVAMAGHGTAPGTTGSTSLCWGAICSVKTDNTTTIGHYGIPSTTVAGEIHDTGNTTATANTDSFLITSVGTAGNPVTVEIGTPDWYAAQAAAKVYTLEVNGTALTAGDTVNLNATTPAAAGGVVNIPIATSKSGTIDSIAAQLPAQYAKGSCTEVWGGSGTANAMQSGDDAIVNNSCYNDSGVTRTITAVKCRSDNAANTTVLTPTFGSAGTGTAILTGTVTCGNSYAYSATGTVNNASWTTGTGIDPGMSTVGNATSIAMIVEFTF